MSERPFHDHARRYLELGWQPLPLPPRRKERPPTGFTGSKRDISADDVEGWLASRPGGSNIALRLPRTVIGIDVDDYIGKDGKHKGGAAVLARFEAALGALPATVRITSRDGASGILLYRVPADARIDGDLAGGAVELLHHGWRYAMAPPSVHPDGRPYRLLDDRQGGAEGGELPRPEELPALPASWLPALHDEGLRRQILDDGACTEVRPAVDDENDNQSLHSARSRNGTHGFHRGGIALEDDVFDEINRAERWHALLAGDGWALGVDKGDETHWTRPGKDPREGTSAVLHEPDGPLVVFTTSVADLRRDWAKKGSHYSYSLSGYLAAMRFGGDFAELARAYRRAGGSAPPSEAPSAAEWAVPSPAESRTAAEWTDSGVAQRLAVHLEGRYLYVAKWRAWMRWDGRRWAADDGESVYEEARRWVVEQRVALIAAGDSDGDKAARPYSNRTRLDNAVRMAQRMDSVRATPDQFDLEHSLLNARNGVVDLRTGALAPHNPAHMMTKLADADYIPDARHDDVDAMLDAIPAAVRPWAQRWAGYCATGDTSEDVVMILDGAGANGKSTFLAAMHAALGEYAGPIDVRCVMKSDHEDHRTIYASLHGRRLATISELPEGGRLNVEKVKAISGGDTMVARRVYQDDFAWKPTHKLAFATNHRPVVGAADGGIWRRLKLLGFPYRYAESGIARPGERIRDAGLRARLERPDQRAAMLAWLVAGAVQWHARGLGHDKAVEAAVADWQRSQDTLARFIDERLQLDPTLAVGGARLYSEYADWCFTEGHHKRSNTKFAEDFYAHRLIAGGVIRRRTHSGTEYVGIGIRPRSDDGGSLSAVPAATAKGGDQALEQGVAAGVGTSQTFSESSHGEVLETPTPAATVDDWELF